MSRLPAPILPSNSTGIADSPWLGSPRIPNPAGGLAASLGGIAQAAGAIGQGMQRSILMDERQRKIDADEAERQAEKQRRIDEAARSDANQRFLTDLETKLIVARQGGKEAASQADPVEAGKAYDAAFAPLIDEIEGIEDPDLRSRATLQYTRTFYGGRNDVGDMSLRRLAESSRAAVATLGQTLVKSVTLGDERPETAIARHAEAVDGATGTSYTGEQAVAAKEAFQSEVVSRYADRLIEASATDPSAAEPLREFMGTDMAKQSLTAVSRRRVLSSLDEAEKQGHVSQFRGSVQGGHEGVVRLLTTDDSPEFLGATIDPEGTVASIDGLVDELVGMPGRAYDSTPERPMMSEQQVRAAVLDGMIEFAAESGDSALFSLVEDALAVPGVGGRKIVDGDLAAKVERLRSTLTVAEKAKSEKRSGMDTIEASFTSGSLVPESMLGSEAIAPWAAEKMNSVPAPKVAEFLVRGGMTIPEPVLNRVKAGFDLGAQDGQIAESIQILQTVQRYNPDEARRLAEATDEPDIAGVVLELGGDPGMAKMLMSKQGKAGLDAAAVALEGVQETKAEPGIDPITPLTGLSAAGYELSPDSLTPSIAERWDAAFKLGMARAATRGQDVASEATHALIAKQAAAEVLKSHSSIQIQEASEGWIYDSSPTMLVPSEKFGLRSEANGRDVATDRFEASMNEATSRFDPFWSSPTAMVRPDLAVSTAVRGQIAADIEVLVPVIDNTSGTVIEFVGWDPITRQQTRVVDQGAPEFSGRLRAFEAQTPLSALDPDAKYRRPRGGTVGYLSESQDAVMAELFDREMRTRYQNADVGMMTAEQYLEVHAISLGWEGWAPPPKEQP
jgi:hypothetical protein